MRAFSAWQELIVGGSAPVPKADPGDLPLLLALVLDQRRVVGIPLFLRATGAVETPVHTSFIGTESTIAARNV